MKLRLARPAVGFTVAAALLTTTVGAGSVAASAHDSNQPPTQASRPALNKHAADTALSKLERAYDTRLGVYALDTGTGRSISWRAGERFAFASTIKAPLSAAVLDRISRKDLSRVIRFDESDLVPYSPITELNLEDGMTVQEVIDAALRFSDNTAANLLYEEIGGPAGLDRALDRVGDRVTDPERIEPDLNTAIPGDRRDTTTPKAIASSLGTYLLGNALPKHDRELLRTTMINNTTGDELIRAGVPAGWVVADKTGSADYGVRNDIAVAYPPGRAPILIAVMSSRGQVDEEYDNKAIADATRVAVSALNR